MFIRGPRFSPTGIARDLLSSCWRLGRIQHLIFYVDRIWLWTIGQTRLAALPLGQLVTSFRENMYCTQADENTLTLWTPNRCSLAFKMENFVPDIVSTSQLYDSNGFQDPCATLRSLQLAPWITVARTPLLGAAGLADQGNG